MPASVKQRFVRRLFAILIAAAVGYGRHAYLTGYIKGREDCWRDIERADRRYRSSKR